jgi:outer membrane murein-binding lipoprotein Lpp
MHHNQTCGDVILNCDDCNAAVPRWKMEAHQTKECPNALRQCEFEFFGCSQWFKISQIKYHNEQANQVHMEMLAHAVKDLVGQVGRLQTDVVALRSDVTSIQGELKGLGEGLKRQEDLAAKQFKNIKTAANETSQTQKTDMSTLRDALEEQAQTFSTQMLNSYEESVRTTRALGEFRQSQLEFNSSHLEKSGQWMSNIEQRLDVIAEDVSSKILSNYNTIVEGLRDEHNWVAGKLNDLQTELHTEVGNCQAATHAKVMNIFEHVQNIGRKYI